MKQVDELSAIETAREVLRMASLKHIEVREEVSTEPGSEAITSTRLTWSPQEKDALRELFQECIPSFGGRKPPIGYISQVLKDNKDTATGKTIIAKNGLTAKKIQDNIVIKNITYPHTQNSLSLCH